MYPRALRNILNVSKHLKRPISSKNVSLVFPAFTFGTAQKVLFNSVYTARCYSSDSESLFLPKDPQSRKNYIEETAEKEIKKLMEENPELEKLRKIYELEIDVMRHDGERVPNHLRPRDWLELLKLPNQTGRK